eukprot:jgi/Psemu1/28814/gm1.28814_g
MNDHEDAIQNGNDYYDLNMERREGGDDIYLEEGFEGDDNFALEEDFESDESGAKYVAEHCAAAKEASMEDEDNEQEKEVSEFRHTVLALWKTGLEIFIHQLLYRRRVYPEDTFSPVRFVGAECKINRNPDVLIYIAEALKVIIPMIFSGVNERNVNETSGHNDRHQSKEILVEIYDGEEGTTYEQYSLSFLSGSPADESIDITSAVFCASFSLASSLKNQSGDLADLIIGEVEKDLRDLVCSTGKLEGLQSGDWDDLVSFKILLLMNPTTNNDDGGNHDTRNAEQSTELDKALNDAKWCRAAIHSSMQNNRTKNRVIWNLTNSACQFQFRLVPSQKKVTKKMAETGRASPLNTREL